MRLLHTMTKTLQEFGVIPPAYAILSHRWDDREVTLQDMSSPDVTKFEGYAKLSAACDKARHLGFHYLWMDTCCIDKTSSAELSEAINSMFMWYKHTELCIVYLQDVRGNSDQDAWQEQFSRSVWFSRGWTLQELLAPAEVLFVDRDWKDIGMKSFLSSLLTQITGIDEFVLLTGDMEAISIAAKMSWAAFRDTTRPEDMAYSLMGIFDVNMPTIYGEGGKKAFLRLQDEIIKKSNDQSIFAWGKCVLVILDFDKLLTHIREGSRPAVSMRVPCDLGHQDFWLSVHGSSKVAATWYRDHFPTPNTRLARSVWPQIFPLRIEAYALICLAYQSTVVRMYTWHSYRVAARTRRRCTLSTCDAYRRTNTPSL